MDHSQSGAGLHAFHQDLLVQATGRLTAVDDYGERALGAVEEATAAASFSCTPGDVLELQQLEEQLRASVAMAGHINAESKALVTKMRRLCARAGVIGAPLRA